MNTYKSIQSSCYALETTKGLLVVGRNSLYTDSKDLLLSRGWERCNPSEFMIALSELRCSIDKEIANTMFYQEQEAVES